ncbi:uncharacterized protein LOC129758805 [Uranotaenia lowii]|uniref:uncharacterized protein LOC129758805 n=1 Tax=Uranotaenia lowii TaxID=190385 RepID=UPI0024783DE8|nr:uncharacterized protein LOC129758805 [Uranotaenia lowii]
MFRNTYQSGFLTVFSSSGSKPLEIWDVVTKNGHSKRVTDEDLKLMSYELMGSNVATTYMVAPRRPCPSLGVKLPFLVLLVKNLRKFFSFEIQILDDRNLMRRFRASNYQSSTRVDNFCTVMPLALTPGWNQIQFNLADFTRRAYGTNYIETVRLQIHANIRVKRIYFSDRLYNDDEVPAQLRLHPPPRPTKLNEIMKGKGKKKSEIQESVRPTTPVPEGEEAEEQLPGVVEEVVGEPVEIPETGENPPTEEAAEVVAEISPEEVPVEENVPQEAVDENVTAPAEEAEGGPVVEEVVEGTVEPPPEPAAEAEEPAPEEVAQ